MITPFPYIAKTNAVQDIVGVVTENPLTAGLNTTYAFVSYGDAQGSTEYAHGTASVTGINTENYFEIVVETNSVEGFVGNRYWVSKDAKYGDDNLYQLYEDGEGATATGIYVKIDLIYTDNVMPSEQDAEPTPEPEPEPTPETHVELAPQELVSLMVPDAVSPDARGGFLMADEGYTITSASALFDGTDTETVNFDGDTFASVADFSLEDTTWNDKYVIEYGYDTILAEGEHSVVLTIVTTDGTFTVEYTLTVAVENDENQNNE